MPADLWRLIRAHEWWHYKLPVALAVAFAFAGTAHVSVDRLILPTLFLLAAGTAAAIYASVFNDFMDIDQDRAAGKTTPMMQLSKTSRWLVMLASLALMTSVVYLFAPMQRSLACFLLIWANYTAYSLPPVRLKERGFWGVLSIATGEHLLAAMLAICLVADMTGCPIKAIWLVPLLAWSLTFGCRSILWHQLADIENDRVAGCTTFGALFGYESLRRIGERLLFPVEVISFLFLLICCNNAVAWLFLLIHLFLDWFRYKFWHARIFIVAPEKEGRFALFEYYQIFFPLAFLASELPHDPSVVFFIAAFCLLFAAPLAHMIQVFPAMRWHLLTPMIRRLKGRLKQV